MDAHHPTRSQDADPLHREHRDTRTPAKKNRRRLDTTQEEEDAAPRSRSNSGSPPLSASPPQEMKIKVRQISQGVEDLSWRNMKAITPEREFEVEAQTIMPADNVQEQDSNAMVEGDAPEAPAGENGVSLGEASCSPPSQLAPDAEVPLGTSIPEDPSAGFPSRRSSDSDNGENVLKRKFPERGTSHPPQENGHPAKAAAEPLKRPRDDSDQDDNPRETKRPSPPPEPKSPKRTPSSPVAAPKLVCMSTRAC